MGKNNRPRKSPVPLIIGALMIVAVIILKVLSSKEENKNNPTFLFLGVLVVVGGFTAVIVYLSIKSARQRKLLGEDAPKKKTPSDIAMYVSAGVGGAGLLALLWSLCFTENVNFLVILAELAVFVAGFSVTYSVFCRKKKRGDFADNEDDNKGEQK